MPNDMIARDATLRVEPLVSSRRATTARVPVASVVAAIVCAAFFAAWMLPYHTYPYYSFYSDYISLMGIVVGLLVLYFDDRRHTARIPAAVIVPVGLALVVAVDAWTGRMWAPREAVVPFGYLTLAGGAMVLGRNLAGDGAAAQDQLDRTFDFFCGALIAAGVLSALITFCQYLGVDDRLGDWSAGFGNDGVSAIRPYANLGQPNQLALILSWSLAASWRMFVRDIASGPVSFIVALILLASMALTQSKLAWLIIPALVALAWFGNRMKQRKVSRAALLALVATFVVFVLALPAFSHLLGIMTEDVAKRMETNGVRSVMILQGLYIGLQHPFTGVGWAGFAAGQIAVAPLFGETQYAAHAHDFVANLAAETGWLVTACVVVAIGIWLYRRYLKRSLTTNTLFASMVFAAVGIHSLVEFPLWYAYVLVPTAFLVGLTDCELRITSRLASTRLQVVAFSLIAALAMAGVAADYRGLVQAFRAFGLQRVGIVYEQGSFVEPQWTIFPHFYRYMRFAHIKPTVDMKPGEIEEAERVAGRFGYAPVLMRMATIYALNGRPDDAVRLVIAMSHLYPQRYRETYEAWRDLAHDYPAVLGKVFERLPAPTHQP